MLRQRLPNGQPVQGPCFIPDQNLIINPIAASMSTSHANGNVGLDPRQLNYETSDLNEITKRQMNEDIQAYRYDLDFCRSQLTSGVDLTTQEIRTLQIRILDCGHQIRHCQHRIQQIDAAQSRAAAARTPAKSQFRGASTPVSTGVKRQRTKNDDDGDDDQKDSIEVSGGSGMANVSVQRLGFWKCRLCTSQKFLDAGPNRTPSAPCKWPLKDVSKMLNHFLDLHTEHSPSERCQELGDALAQNRGPFEYWLTRTRGQDVNEEGIIDAYIETLQAGAMPDPLRGLNRAAGIFPNKVSGEKR
ncbi:hypothetical protein F4778DRAFT_673662 [Xylariomycetidae sp. FL2044]|nr:hypothetical protein F4778DRAFT_673662 [Xylariomycetidae sp. FL2044]